MRLSTEYANSTIKNFPELSYFFPDKTIMGKITIRADVLSLICNENQSSNLDTIKVAIYCIFEVHWPARVLFVALSRRRFARQMDCSGSRHIAQVDHSVIARSTVGSTHRRKVAATT